LVYKWQWLDVVVGVAY